MFLKPGQPPKIGQRPCWQHLTAYGEGLPEAQRKRIHDAVAKLIDGVQAHEQMREYFDHAPTQAEQIRKLGRDLAECVLAILNARAEAFWSLGAVEEFRKRLETDADDLLERALACVDKRDLPFLKLLSSTGDVRASPHAVVRQTVASWVRRAQLEFQPTPPPSTGDAVPGPSHCVQTSEMASGSESGAADERPEKTKPALSSSWEEVELFLVSDTTIQPKIRGEGMPPMNYAEMGFEDRRKKIPNSQWVTLRSLAENGGEISTAKTMGPERSKLEKRVQKLRQTLRKCFGIEGDPVPFVKGDSHRPGSFVGYRARFKIGVRPSYNTASHERL